MINFNFKEETSNKKQKSNDLLQQLEEKKASLPIKHIIIDMSCVNRVDSEAIKSLTSV